MGLPRCDGVTILHTLRNVTEYAGFKIFAVSGHSPENAMAS